MDQLRSIDLSLHLIRNLAYVGDDDERGSGIGHRLHEDFLVALAQHDALETLVLLEQQSINQVQYTLGSVILPLRALTTMTAEIRTMGILALGNIRPSLPKP